MIIEINEFLSFVNKNHLKIQLPVESSNREISLDFCWLLMSCNSVIFSCNYFNGNLFHWYSSIMDIIVEVSLVIEGTIKIMLRSMSHIRQRNSQ